MASSSSLSSIHSKPMKYDVFLSFRGEDTRRGFTDHLYKWLQSGGINTFRDDNEIQGGATISPVLLKAIEASRIAIIVLSNNYASSTWCLEELIKIFECKENLDMDVLPIFYDVDPSDVRKQNGSFARAFVKHEESFGVDDLKVQRWRQVLTKVANLKGWSSQDWKYETELIEEIYEAILRKIQPTLIVTQEEKLVGIDSKLEYLLAHLLDRNSSGIVSVGIWGMGGIGKTTIARVVYEKICHRFEVCCFLSEVSENCQTHGLPYLQSKLLSRIVFMKKSFDILNADEGFVMIERVFRYKKVLLVLDNVDQLDQIEKLIPNQDVLSCGSRIIITTRNEDLLISSGVERRYRMEMLGCNEGLQLLSSITFKQKSPKEGYLDLAKSIVNLVRGLPLALQVLGSFLRNKDVSIWNNTIEALQLEGVDHEDKIFKVLKISYDGLDEKQKEIFLDIACFFKGKKKERVVEILDGCGFNATRRIEFLVRKSLVSISKNDELQMHDLLQEMGRNIVHQQLQNRLCCYKDVKKYMVKQEIQSIRYKPTKNAQIPISFSRMNQLRLLNVHNVQLQNHSECVFTTELRYLKWKEYSFKFLPLSSEENELIELHMCHSNLEEFWRGEKHLEKLKYIKLSHSEKLFKTPNFAKVPNLTELNLEGCTSLVNIHPSIFAAKRLIYLNLKDCMNLTHLPRFIKIEVLEVFNLSGCSKIKKIPEFEGNTERLSELYLESTSISELPSSIENLSGLILLKLKNCCKLKSLPRSISMLKCLQSLDISGCSILADNQDDDNEELDVRGTAIRGEESVLFVLHTKIRDGLVHGMKWLIPHYFSYNNILPRPRSIPSLHGMFSLTKLNLGDCNLDVVPDGIGSLFKLKELSLYGNSFSHLPETISQLTNLQQLNIRECKKLLLFPKLPPWIFGVWSGDCISLGNIPDISKIRPSIHGKYLEFLNCCSFADNKESYELLMTQIQKETVRGRSVNTIFPGSEFPEWFRATKMGEGGSIIIDFSNPKWIDFTMCAIVGPIGNNANVPFTLLAEMSYQVLDDPFQNKASFHLGLITSASKMKLDHIVIVSQSRKIHHSCDRIEFLLRILQNSTLPSIQVKKCGLHLMNVEK